MHARIFPDTPALSPTFRLADIKKISRFQPPDEWFEILTRASRPHGIDPERRLVIAYTFSPDGEAHLPLAEFDTEKLVEMVERRKNLMAILFANWENNSSFYSVLAEQTRLLEDACLKLQYTPAPLPKTSLKTTGSAQPVFA